MATIIRRIIGIGLRPRDSNLLAGDQVRFVWNNDDACERWADQSRAGAGQDRARSGGKPAFCIDRRHGERVFGDMVYTF
jgi:hypothetical protein